MDLFYFVDERLKFISYFYEHTVSVFQETIRKIEAGEPPYVDTRDPEYAEEPAFLAEWEDANAALNIAGGACLELLQSTLHSFLHEYLNEIGQRHLISHLHEMNKKSQFGNYRALFLEVLGIDWSKSGADVELLEQVILTRNDFSHNLDFLSLNVYQSPAHASKYPDSAFADLRWRTLVFRKVPLKVTKEASEKGSAALRQLCRYLDGERIEFFRRLRALRKTGDGNAANG